MIGLNIVPYSSGSKVTRMSPMLDCAYEHFPSFNLSLCGDPSLFDRPSTSEKH